MHLKEASPLIEAIYDAALDPARWPLALQALCEVLSAKAATIQVFEPLNGNKLRLSIEHGTDKHWTELLHTKYAALCPIGPILLLADIDRPSSIFDYIDEEEFQETRFYREWCAPQGYYDMAGALTARRAQEVGTFSALGAPGKGRFSAGDLEILGLLAPHVRRAVTLADIIQRRPVAVVGFEAVIDLLPTGILLVGEDASLIRANVAAQALLANGNVMRERGGIISLLDPKADRALRKALTDAGKEPALVPVTRADGTTLTAAVVKRCVGERGSAILLHETKLDLPAHGKHLVATFGFTPREIAVLMPLLEGRNVSDVAESLGVSTATVRTHVNKLLAKSGSERQADLVQKVLRAMPPVLMS